MLGQFASGGNDTTSSLTRVDTTAASLTGMGQARRLPLERRSWI